MCRRVQIISDPHTDRLRAACDDCPWTSPWVTPGPPWPDAPPRSPGAVLLVAERAAAAHLRRRG
jgi:hypothetical protein